MTENSAREVAALAIINCIRRGADLPECALDDVADPSPYLTQADAVLAALPADERLREAVAALRDIAEAEPIPTAPKAFIWCREVARTALTKLGVPHVD